QPIDGGLAASLRPDDLERLERVELRGDRLRRLPGGGGDRGCRARRFVEYEEDEVGGGVDDERRGPLEIAIQVRRHPPSSPAHLSPGGRRDDRRPLDRAPREEA